VERSERNNVNTIRP